MAVCETFDPECYGCRLRADAPNIAPSATPSRMNSVPPPKANPAWERGVVTQKRPGGTEMPVFRPGSTSSYLRVKEAGERRREIDRTLKDYATRTTPLPS
jgi:hypothetical protein